VRSADKPLKVSFFGHFGSSNSGNESTLLTILSRLRDLVPESEFFCICTNPGAIVARDGIKALPITTRRIKIWDRGLPLARRVPLAFVGVGAELRQYARAFSELKGTDVLIVPGTGLMTDVFGLHQWGPYSLFKWVLMAKLRRSRVLFLSVFVAGVDLDVRTKVALELGLNQA
jgi:polysaccharide pyruvyl transferase WcaK-like protein